MCKILKKDCLSKCFNKKIKMKIFKSRIFILIIPLLAFLFYSVTWQNVNMTKADTIGYTKLMSDISDGQIDEITTRTPGYPLLLLLTGSSQDSNSILFFVQLLMYVLCVILLSNILYELNVSKKSFLHFL